MLQKLGWKQGEGLRPDGIVDPVNKLVLSSIVFLIVNPKSNQFYFHFSFLQGSTERQQSRSWCYTTERNAK